MGKHFPKTSFFMSWNANWSLATNQNVEALHEHPTVANREDPPKRLFENTVRLKLIGHRAAEKP